MNSMKSLQVAGRFAAVIGVMALFGHHGAPLVSAATSDSEAAGEVVTRRLTPEQYRNVIADVFGPTIKLGGRFEPDIRIDGLLEIGSGRVAVSAAGMEQYDAMARTIAAQVVDEERRAMFVPCVPRSETENDEACLRQFITQTGQLLYRRPLTQDEVAVQMAAGAVAIQNLKSFYGGLTYALAAMLESPQFLFRHERLEPDPRNQGAYRLDAYSKASRLSFFLWNTVPDPALLNAAAKGELDTARGLQRQVDRMMASPRLNAGVRAFFSDMLHFDQIDTLTKDTTIYPKFNAQVAEQAREQTLRTLVEHLLTQRGDYRDIFTTRKTFLTQTLASVYRLPLVNHAPNGSPDFWQPYEFAADDPRAGLLMQISFVTLHSHPGRSSPTLRGKAVRELLLCQKVPAPPGDVEFQLVQDTSHPVYKTARARLAAHSTEAVCAGCHKITDPIGLALESFDGGGSYRATENGVPIDTTGVLDGIKFANGGELGAAVRANPAAPSCLVDRLTAYALGRPPAPAQRPWVNGLKSAFAEEGYVVPALMRRIANSPEFYRVAAARE